MTATHTAYPLSSKAHTSIVAYFQNIINHLAGQRLISGCLVARASASSVTVAAGTYTPATPATTTYAGATISGISACAASNHRYDLVYLDTADGTAKVATGTPAVPTNAAKFLENVAPQPPDLPSETAILLAVLCVDENGIRSTDNDGSVAGCADMRMTTNVGYHLASYLYAASQARGDLMMMGASSWGRLPTSTIGKYLAAGGAGADLVWSDVLIGSLTATSQARGDIVHRGSVAWDRLVAGSANKYLMSNGTGNDLTYEDLKIGSLTVASQAQGDLVMRGATTWGRLGVGTVNKYLMSNGAGSDLSYEYLKIPSLSVTSEAQGDLIMRGAAAWGRLGTGTANQVLTSGGAGADLVWATKTWPVSFVFGDGSAVILAQEMGVGPFPLACKITAASIREQALISSSATVTLHIHDRDAAIGDAVDTFSLSSATNYNETGLTHAVAAGKWVTIKIASITAAKQLQVGLTMEAT